LTAINKISIIARKSGEEIEEKTYIMFGTWSSCLTIQGYVDRREGFADSGPPMALSPRLGVSTLLVQGANVIQPHGIDGNLNLTTQKKPNQPLNHIVTPSKRTSVSPTTMKITRSDVPRCDSHLGKILRSQMNARLKDAKNYISFIAITKRTAAETDQSNRLPALTTHAKEAKGDGKRGIPLLLCAQFMAVVV
jgi:hypothetical protein